MRKSNSNSNSNSNMATGKMGFTLEYMIMGMFLAFSCIRVLRNRDFVSEADASWKIGERKPSVKQVRPFDIQRDFGALGVQLRHIRGGQEWPVLGDFSGSQDHSRENLSTSEEPEANVAFFVQIAPNNILMAPRLLSRMWHPRNIYCLHFDQKIPTPAVEVFQSALRSNSKLSNVFTIPSASITYAGISMLLNTLESMSVLLTTSPTWDYYINLSGSDYPLVSPTGIRRLLGLPHVRKWSISFIHFNPNISNWDRFAQHRLGNLHFDLSLGFHPTLRAGLVHTSQQHPVLLSRKLRLKIGKGEGWIIAHRSFCEFAAFGNVARRLLTMFANMEAPDEHFFQTLSWNHIALNKSVARHSLREVAWSHEGQRSGQHPFYLDVRDANGSWTFWERLALSPSLFARKFSVPDSPLMDHIDTTKSGAVQGGGNLSATTASFSIVKEHFTCVSDLEKRRLEPKIMTCGARRNVEFLRPPA